MCPGGKRTRMVEPSLRRRRTLGRRSLVLFPQPLPSKHGVYSCDLAQFARCSSGSQALTTPASLLTYCCFSSPRGLPRYSPALLTPPFLYGTPLRLLGRCPLVGCGLFDVESGRAESSRRQRAESIADSPRPSHTRVESYNSSRNLV
jgi:hypothetical protein